MRPKVLALLPLFFFHNASRVLTLTFIWIILLSRIPSSVVSVSDDRRAKSHLLTKKTKDKLVTGCMHFADSHRQYTAFPKHLSLTVTVQLSAKTINKILNVQTSSGSSCSVLFLSLQSTFSCLQDFINFHLISFHFLFSSFTWTKSRSILHCSVFFSIFLFQKCVYARALVCASYFWVLNKQTLMITNEALTHLA